MILTRDSIAVVIASKGDLPHLPTTLKVWISVCLNYWPGSELVIVDREADPEKRAYIESVVEDYANSGLKIVYIPSASRIRLSVAYNKARKYVSASRVLFTTGSDYPSGKILSIYNEEQDKDAILLGTVDHVKGAFNHSTIGKEFQSFDMGYLNLEESRTPWEYFTSTNFVAPRKMLDNTDWFKHSGPHDWATGVMFSWRAFNQYGARFKSVPAATVFNITDSPMSKRSRPVVKESDLVMPKS